MENWGGNVLRSRRYELRWAGSLFGHCEWQETRDGERPGSCHQLPPFCAQAAAEHTTADRRPDN